MTVTAPVVPTPPSAAQWRRWGIDPVWSRAVDVPSHDGGSHRWHVLERSPADQPRVDESPIDGDAPRPTIVCVHGNPTWSYLWRPFLAELGDTFRVVAPDQLGMGWSERPGRRRYAERVRDLDDLLQVLVPSGPVVLVAHDWGGAIAMGWAVEHADRVAAMVLANTGIAVPAGRQAPGIIRLAATRGVLDVVCRRTSVFVDGTARLSRRRIGARAREALRAPYRRPADRTAIAEFVDDIPLDDSHPSAAAIADVAARLGDLDVPVLLVWGAADPVFDDDFADDLLGRFRHAELHRFPTASHLVVAEEDVAGVARDWLSQRLTGSTSPAAPPADAERRPVWAGLTERTDDAALAFHDGASGRSVTFAELDRMVRSVAAGLRGRGVKPGDRVAVLVPPSVELVALVYACWRIGAVTVIADRGLGVRGLGRAVRSARVRWLVGPPRAVVAARALRWAPGASAIGLGEVVGFAAGDVPASDLPAGPGPGDPAAVLFTSGATGPAKGVRYTHGQLAAQRDALAGLYSVGAGDRFVAAFAPFALYGPALGIGSAVPDVDVTRPGTLTAGALDAACRAIGATMVFASPSALANVVATAPSGAPPSGLAAVRLVMSAGAPVPVATLRAMSALAPAAELHTPYGMTECLPVADVDLAAIEAAGAETIAAETTGARTAGATRGVLVGRPVAGCSVMIAPLGFDAAVPVAPVPAGETGEVLVDAPWVSDGYDRLWRTQFDARPCDADGRRWHRSGDVGHVDAEGRVWIEGRSVHVIHTVDGPVAPVPVEVVAERIDGVRRAAAVGVGPSGVQQVVVVLETGRRGLADDDRARRVRDAVRDALGVGVAAVCTIDALPVDIRHNAKIDRAAVAAWADRLLAGGRA